MKAKTRLIVGIVAAILVAVIGITTTLIVTGIKESKQDYIVRNADDLIKAAKKDTGDKQILFANDISVDGDVNMTYLNSIDLNGYTLTINGDFIISSSQSKEMTIGSNAETNGKIIADTVDIDATKAHIEWSADVAVRDSLFTVNVSPTTFAFKGVFLNETLTVKAEADITLQGGTVDIQSPQEQVNYKVIIPATSAETSSVKVVSAIPETSKVEVITSKSVEVAGVIAVSTHDDAPAGIEVKAAAQSTLQVSGKIEKIEAQSSSVTVETDAQIGSVTADTVSNKGTVTQVTATNSVVNEGTISGTVTATTVDNKENAEIGGKVTATGDVTNSGTVAEVETNGKVENSGTVSGEVKAESVDNKENAEIGGKVTATGDVTNSGTVAEVETSGKVENSGTVSGDVQGSEVNNTDDGTVGGDIIITTKQNQEIQVTIQGWTYGGTANAPVGSGKAIADATETYSYKVKGADDSTYTNTVPTQAGEYTVRYHVTGNDTYNPAKVTCDFTIAKATFTATVTIQGWTYGGTANAPQVTGNTSEGEITYAYYSGTTLLDGVPTNAGTYKVVATIAATANYEAATAEVEFTIAKAENTATISIEGWAVGGTANAPQIANDLTNASSYTAEYKVIGADDNTYTTTVPTTKGIYVVRVIIAANDNYLSQTLTQEFSIGVQVVIAPEELEGTWTYTGDTLTYNLATSELYTISGNTQTNAGTHTVTVSLNDKENCSWSDGTTADKTYNWIIAKAENTATISIENWTYGGTAKAPQVSNDSTQASAYSYEYKLATADDSTYTATVPTASGTYTVRTTIASNVNYLEKVLTANFAIGVAEYEISFQAPESLVYDSTEKEITVIGFVSDIMTVTGNKKTNAGEYTVTVSLNDKVNCQWSDGTTTDKKYTWTIAKAENTATISIESWTYGGEAKAPQIANDLTNASSYTAEYKVVGTDDNTYTTAVPTTKGSYVVRVIIAANDNYLSQTLTQEFSIGVQVVIAPEELGGTWTYTGDTLTYDLATSELYTITGNTQTNAGEYTVTVSLNDKVNCQWSDGTTTDKKYTWTIAKANIELSLALTGDKAWAVRDYQSNTGYFDLAGNSGNGAVTYTYYIGTTADEQNIAEPNELPMGKNLVVVSVAESDNYNAGTARLEIEITVNAQDIQNVEEFLAALNLNEGTIKLTAKDGIEVSAADFNTNYGTSAKALTIDLNGKNLTVTAEGQTQHAKDTATEKNSVTIFIAKEQTLTITDSTSQGTATGEGLASGTLNLYNAVYTKAAIGVKTGGTLKIENIKIDAWGSVAQPDGDAASIEFNNTQITTSGVYVIATNSTKADESKGVAIRVISSVITMTADDNDSCAILLNVDGTLDIKDSKITAQAQGVFVRAGKATIKDTEIKTTAVVEWANKYVNATAWTNGNNVANSALIVGSNGKTGYKGDAKVTVTGGLIKSVENDNAFAIYLSHLMSGSYTSSLALDGTTVVGKTIATVKTEEQLQNAVNAYDTVMLATDITLTSTITMKNDVTLDLNGKTVTIDETYAGGDVALRVEDGNVEIKNGTVDATKAPEKFVPVAMMKKEAENATLTLNELNVTVDTLKESALYAWGGDIIVNSGTYKNIAEGNYEYKKEWKPLVLNVYNKVPGKITVNGGEFVGNDILLGDDNHGYGTYIVLGEGCVVTVADGIQTVTTETADLYYTVEDGKLTANVSTAEKLLSVVSDSTVEVIKLKENISVVVDDLRTAYVGSTKISNNTVTLDENRRLTALTIDLNGKDLTLTHSAASQGQLTQTGKTFIVVQDQSLTITDSTSQGTATGEGLSSGTLKLHNANYTQASLGVRTGGTLKIENIKIDAWGTVAQPDGDAASVEFNNTQITASGVYGIGTNAVKAAGSAGAIITFKSSTLTMTAKDNDSCAFCITIDCTLNIEDSKITAQAQGVFVRAGTATIKNTEIETVAVVSAAANYVNASAWDSGNNVANSALIVGSSGKAGYKGDAKVTVIGGSITSVENENAFAIYLSHLMGENYTSSLTLDGTEVVGKTIAFVKTGEQLQNAVNAYDTVMLATNITLTSSLTIDEGKTVTIDLNGCEIVNDGGAFDTITNNGTLTIVGNGIIDNVTHAKAALKNNGTATIGVADNENTPLLTRSAENGQSAKDNGGNSYYVIQNLGTMTIENATVNANGKYSSLIANGWYNSSDVNSRTATLTINGGTFSGGINTVKNDEAGILEINGGNFINVAQYAIQNWNIATIKGGEFTTTASEVIHNGTSVATSVGNLTINGGTFKAPDGYATVLCRFASTDASINKGLTVTTTISGITYKYVTSTESGIYELIDRNMPVVLNSNIMLSERLEIAEGKTVTIDLNGKTITVPPADDSGTSYYAIENHGTLTIKDTSTDQKGAIKSRGIRNIGGTLTLLSGTIASIDSNGGGAAIWNEGTAYIRGGTLQFTGSHLENNAGALFVSNASNATAEISGVNWESVYIAISVNSGNVNISDSTITTNNPVEVGTKWNAVKVSGGTMTLNNVIINTSLSGAIQVAGGTADITDCKFTQTPSAESGQKWNSMVVAVSNGGTANVHSGTYSSQGYGAFVYSSGGTINIYGGTFSANKALLKADTSPTAGPSTINVYDGIFNKYTHTNQKDIIIEKATSTSINIMGGKFETDISDYLSEDYATTYELYYYVIINAAATEEALKNLIDSKNDVKVKLTDNITLNSSLTIDEGKTVSIYLNGCTIVNGGAFDTITNNGTLTIFGYGTIDNVTHAKAALKNYGTAEIGYDIVGDGSTPILTRSKENGTSTTQNGGNSYYVIENLGSLKIFRAYVKFGTNNDRYSSLIRNGNESVNAFLQISSGTFTGGLNTIKNEPLATVELAGGEFTTTNQYALLNYGTADVIGGTFTTTNTAHSAIYNGLHSKGEGKLTLKYNTLALNTPYAYAITNEVTKSVGDNISNFENSGVYFFRLDNKWQILGIACNETTFASFLGNELYAAVKLNQNITLTKTIEISRKVEILNGYAITIDGTYSGGDVAIRVVAGGDLTIYATIDATNAPENVVPLAVMGTDANNLANMTIVDGIYTVDTNTESVVFAKHGTVTIQSGSFSNNATGAYAYNSNLEPLVFNVWNNDSVNSKIIIDGTIIGKGHNPIFGDDNTEAQFLDTTKYYTAINSDGNFIVCDLTASPSVQVAFKVEDGTMNAYVYNIKGQEIAEKLQANGLVDVIALDGVSLVSNQTQLSNAAKNAEINTIILNDDITIDDTLVIAKDRKLTLDLNGYTLSIDTETKERATIKNNGNLIIKSTLEGGKITRSTQSSYYVIVNEGTMAIGTINNEFKITVENLNANDASSLIANNPDCSQESADTSSTTQITTLTIRGGTFTSAGSNAVKNDEYGKLAINGGVYTTMAKTHAAVQNWATMTVQGTSTKFYAPNQAISVMVYGGQENNTTLSRSEYYAPVAVYIRNGYSDVKGYEKKGTINLILNSKLINLNGGIIAATHEEDYITSSDTIKFHQDLKVEFQITVVDVEMLKYVLTEDYPATTVKEVKATNVTKTIIVKGLEAEQVREVLLMPDYSNLGYQLVEIDDVLQVKKAANVGSASDEETLKNAVANGGIVYLTDDITLTSTLEIAAGKTVELNLNGHTLSIDTATTEISAITNKGTLTIVSSKEGGKITRSTQSSYYVIINEGTMTIGVKGGDQNLTIENLNASDTSSLIINNFDCENTTPATLTVNGGTFTSVGSNAVKNDEYGTLTINGGIYSSTGLKNAAVMNWGEMTISDGTFTGSAQSLAVMAYKNQANVTTITGGTFNDPTGIYIRNGYNPSPAGTVTLSISGCVQLGADNDRLTILTSDIDPIRAGDKVTINVNSSTKVVFTTYATDAATLKAIGSFSIDDNTTTAVYVSNLTDEEIAANIGNIGVIYKTGDALTADVYTGGGMVVATSSAATQINLKNNIIVNDIMRISSEKAARTMTIDLCGNEIYSTQSDGYVFLILGCNTDNYTTVWNDIDLTIKNGTVDGEVKYWAYIFDIRSAKGSANVNVTIEDLICIGECGMYANGRGGGAKIVATNCSFPTGVYLPADNTYEFTNCYFAGEAGAYLKSGTYTFTNCTFKGEGAHYDPVNYNGNGQSSSGAGLAIDSAESYTPTLNVTLENCTFSSVYGCGIFEFITKKAESSFNDAYSSITFKGTTTFGPCGTEYYISSNGKITNGIILAEAGSSLVKLDANGNPTSEQILSGGGVITYKVDNAQMLAQISLLCEGGYDFENQTVLLTSDIDLGGIDWIPIGSFSNSFCGTFDGGNFTISNLTVSSNPNNPEGKKDRSVGLIGYAIGATVKNLKIANCNVSGKYAVGAVVGEADGSSLFENIEILSGTVKADQDVYSIDEDTKTEVLSYSAQVAGGILGIGYGETVNASGNIIYAGTIVFRNCINRANVIVNKQHAGGLWGSITFAGQCDVIVENCSNYGTITSNSISHNDSAGGYAGGLGGFFDAKSLTITNSQNHGIVSAEQHQGDLVGYSSLIDGAVNAAETI